MKPCAQIDDYLDRRLGDGSATRFESHLRGCVDCREQVAFWERTELDLKRADDQYVEREPTARDIRRLVARVKGQRLESAKSSPRGEQQGLFIGRWGLAEAFVLFISLGVGMGIAFLTQSSSNTSHSEMRADTVAAQL